MYISKISSLIVALVVFLFGLFPNSRLITMLYSFYYDWTEITQNITEAVNENDSELLASMASPKMKEEYPDLKERLDAMFDSIEGEVINVENNHTSYLDTERDFSFLITTSETRYSIEILYTALDTESEHKEIGIRRVLMMVETDEYHSWWTDPEHYLAAEVIDTTNYNTTRRWCCGIGNAADNYVFIIEEDYSRLAGYTNVELDISRNNGYGIPASGYALHPGDELKIHFIPEGEDPPAPGTRKPDAVVREEDHPNDWVYYVKPGRYYLYVEPSDNEMYYTVSVGTRL